MVSLHTWHSYGKKAMLTSFNVLIFLDAVDLRNSLKSSSGQTVNLLELEMFVQFYKYID